MMASVALDSAKNVRISSGGICPASETVSSFFRPHRSMKGSETKVEITSAMPTP